MKSVAENIWSDFINSQRTVSIATLAKHMQAERTVIWPQAIVYTFRDGSKLTTTGRGKSHRAMIQTPNGEVYHAQR